MRYLTLLVLGAGLVCALPQTSQAEYGFFNRGPKLISTSTRGVVKDDIKEQRLFKNDLRENLLKASSSAERREIRRDDRPELRGNREEIARGLTLGLKEKTTNMIARLEKVIARLLAPEGIVVKIENRGGNTDTIRAKLSAAERILVQAKQDLENVAAAATSQAANSATSTQARERWQAIRQDYQVIVAALRSAHQNIIEAIRLIKELPRPTTTPTASPATT